MRISTVELMLKDAYSFEAVTLAGDPMGLEQYRGRVALMVNTASRCGFTPQYEGLQHLYEKYAARGFVVLGFPCNQFGHQEPGSESAIAQFCELSFHVSFPMFAKIDVNGPGTHPLYAFLKQSKSGLLGSRAIKWNFTKFLVDRSGRVVKRYAPMTTPASIEADIERLLGAPA